MLWLAEDVAPDRKVGIYDLPSKPVDAQLEVQLYSNYLILRLSRVAHNYRQSRYRLLLQSVSVKDMDLRVEGILGASFLVDDEPLNTLKSILQTKDLIGHKQARLLRRCPKSRE